MKLLLTDNAHIYKTSDGKYYSPSIYSNEFFQRYLDVFDEVRFISKTKYVGEIDTTNYLPITCKGLEIFELPWYQGFKGMISNIFKLIPRYRTSCDGCDCYIFRVAQIESYLAYFLGRKRKKPFAIEVVNDPATFTNLSYLFRKVNILVLKYLAKRANGVSYVTQRTLQKIYPNTAMCLGETSNHFQSFYSSIELNTSDIRNFKDYSNPKPQFELIHVANSINSNVKGHLTVIKTLKSIRDKGYNVSICFIGEGTSVPDFKKFAENLGVLQYVNFIGRLHSREKIIDRLMISDLYFYPTYLEGLPRCIIEAMSAGLPCLSSPIAGIPELLEKKYLFNPFDSDAFAEEIIRLINAPSELTIMSQKNIQTAKKYTNDELNIRRNDFYSKLRNLTDKS